MSVKVTYEDQEYEFVGYFTSEGTHCLNRHGCLIPRALSEPVKGVAYFRLVPVRHTFNGVVYEEIGEKRSATFEEWFLNNSDWPEIWHQDHNSLTPHTILRPVEVVHGQDD